MRTHIRRKRIVITKDFVRYILDEYSALLLLKVEKARSFFPKPSSVFPHRD
jgi:hypothetical protein